MLFLNKRWRPCGYCLPLLNQEIAPLPAIKYLGVFFDSRKNFNAHTEYATNKAMKVIGALSRLMPNTSPLSVNRRKLFLYASPIWADSARKGRNEAWLRRTQKFGLIRVTASYRTASHLSLCVLSGIYPIDITIELRKRIYIEERKKTRRVIATEEDRNWVRDDLSRRILNLHQDALNQWQDRWDTAIESRWVYSWLPNVALMRLSTFAKVDFCVSQMLTGHGCFRAYPFRIKRAASPMCWFGCNSPDDASHNFFDCCRWDAERFELWNRMDLDGPYYPVNVM